MITRERRAKNTAIAKLMILKVELKLGFNNGTAITNAKSCRVK